MEKKNILIAIPTLNSGGVEVSLIRFIKELSKNENISITLLLLKKEGIYLKEVPKNVKILEIKYDNNLYNYNNKKEDIKKYKKFFDKVKFLKIRLPLRNLLKKNNWEEYYKLLLSHVLPIDGKYDLAIDWHGYGHFITTIVADRIIAKKKAMWIHDEKNEWLSKVNFWLDSYDRIFCVGQSCMNNVIKNNKSLSLKTEVFYNMTDYQNIIKKSNEDIDINFDSNVLNIITVGRLEWQKGYDIAIDIAKKLKERNFKYCWYVIGGGTLREELEKLIKENDLDNNFKFLGIIQNPFPYVKKADLYVLSSRHEGYCLATLEAKILNKVIIATNIDSNREQINDGVNGFLCNLDALEFANKIIEVSKNKKLMNNIKDNLSKENFDYTKEFKKLYDLMED